MVMGSKDLLSCTEYRILSLEVSVSLLSADGIWQDSQRIRVDDDDCPFLFVCVVNSVGCASFGQTIVDGKDKIRMVDQPAVKGEYRKKYFDFLEKLRESGEANMYGAVSNLQDAFPELRYNRKRAEDIHLAWIASFDQKGETDEC